MFFKKLLVFTFLTASVSRPMAQGQPRAEPAGEQSIWCKRPPTAEPKRRHGALALPPSLPGEGMHSLPFFCVQVYPPPLTVFFTLVIFSNFFCLIFQCKLVQPRPGAILGGRFLCLDPFLEVWGENGISSQKWAGRVTFCHGGAMGMAGVRFHWLSILRGVGLGAFWQYAF